MEEKGKEGKKENEKKPETNADRLEKRLDVMVCAIRTLQDQYEYLPHHSDCNRNLRTFDHVLFRPVWEALVAMIRLERKEPEAELQVIRCVSLERVCAIVKNNRRTHVHLLRPPHGPCRALDRGRVDEARLALLTGWDRIVNMNMWKQLAVPWEPEGRMVVVESCKRKASVRPRGRPVQFVSKPKTTPRPLPLPPVPVPTTPWVYIASPVSALLLS